MPENKYTYYLWTHGPANQWYVCRAQTNPEKGFEVYYYKHHEWGDQSDYYENHHSSFCAEHKEIDEETASKCIIAGPSFCLEKQREILRNEC